MYLRARKIECKTTLSGTLEGVLGLASISPDVWVRQIKTLLVINH